MINSLMGMDQQKQNTLLFGDLTIVHNVNFNDQNNPMSRMLAMQQQQNMMLAANMQQLAIAQMAAVKQKELALENKIEQIKQIGLEGFSNNSENTKLINVSTKEVEDVEYIVHEEPETIEVIETVEIPSEDLSKVDKIRLLDFFDEEGYFKNEKYSYDKLYKIPEDTRTLICFTSVNKDNPLDWRNKFRKAYLSSKNQPFKGENSVKIYDDTKYIVVVEIKNQYHIIYIKNVYKDDYIQNYITKEDKDNFSKFVMGIKARFDSWNIIVEPMLDNNTCKNYNTNNLMCSVRKDCVFSNAFYTVDPTTISNYDLSF